MCGIVGVISSGDNLVINEMTKAMSHRGPDDFGFYKGDGISLGHHRLSILDLSVNGRQPMFSPDGKWVIVFNGEIYNHLEIREKLSEVGYEFSSTSDTETLLYGYIHFKEYILDKINGIFSFAIYNILEKEIFIARDQFGVKPLYYYYCNGLFLFGSEVKSFLQSDDFNTDLEARGLVNYLNFLWSPRETTPLKFTKKLLAGHYLKFSVDDIKISPVKYYDIPFNGQYLSDKEEQIIDQLERKLLSAVERQLLSDVPVGFFLSGGLDSSLLVSMARRLRPDMNIQAFTIDTHELGESEGFADDLHYAKLVADYLNVKLNVVDANIDIVDDFDKMIWHLDEPQADAAPLNVLNICRKARESGYKVLIGGAAGDDLFSGYRRHQALNFEKYLVKIPARLGKILKNLLNILPASTPQFRRLRKLFVGVDKPHLDRIAGHYSWIPLHLNRSLFSTEIQRQIEDYSPVEYLKSLLSNIPNESNDLNKMLYWEMKTFLPDHNLNYTDKMSMSVGVEVRVPYLDVELVEYVSSIPPYLKMNGNETKYILKKVAERYLPKDVIYRPKTGFGAPVRKWITEDLDWKIDEYLSYDILRKRGIFNPDKVRKLIADNKTGEIDASYTIWCLLAIESWMRQFVDVGVKEESRLSS